MIRQRFYCRSCRRSLSISAFSPKLWEGLNYQVCNDCMRSLEQQSMVPATFETELEVQKTLQKREGGDTEVETPVGFVDLVTDAHVVEIKHVIDWKDGVKVLVYAQHFSDRTPRLHLFGAHTKAFRSLVENSLTGLGITVTWERDPY